MTVITATVCSRAPGDELRRLRESCTELGGAQLAMRLGWHPSKVTNIEKGKARASEIDLVQYLTMCGKDIDFFEDFRRRYKDAFDEYILQVHDNLRTVAFAEAIAKTITSYTPQTVPGPMRTPEYADAYYRLGGFVAEERIPANVRVRIDRQAIMRRPNRPECVFYVHEVRHEALDVRVRVRGPCRLVVAAAG